MAWPGRAGRATPGKAQQSELYQVITLPKDDPRHMPSNGDPLARAEAERIRDWINQGLRWPDGVAVRAPAAASEATAAAPAEPAREAGLPITSAEAAAVAKVQQLHGLAMRLAQNSNWLSVDFSFQGRDVRDADLAALKDMPNLTELSLGGTGVTDAGLVYLEGLTNLTHLQLHKTRITDAGLEHLKGLRRLRSLNLYGTAVTDKGLERLRGLQGLRRLYLWQTKVTAEGAKRLGEAIPGLSIDRGSDADVAGGAGPAQPVKAAQK